MKYRKFGRLDWEVSALGFGLAQLPSKGKDPDDIDVESSVAMLRFAIDLGVNYLNVGWPLAVKRRERLSRVLREALQNGRREKIKIAATLPATKIKALYDFDRYLEDLLKWLRAESIDFLLLGGLNRESWPDLQDIDIIRRAETAMASRKIDHIGFSFHDQYQFLREILEAYDNWTLARFQYSFMDVDHHPGVSGLQLAAANGLGVVVSRPLLGGRLTKEFPESVAAIWADAQPPRPPAEWALRWVWNHPEVSTVVCDMTTPGQLKENAALADTALADSFTVPEELVISKVRDAYRALKPIPCTACRGCMPCHQGIDVPRIFEIYNDAAMYGDTATARSIYRLEKHDLDSCNDCGTCANACGKKIPISDWLKKAHTMLDEDK
jgi:predicted aldo/keto reductase-like oxidoreductase